MTTSRRRPVDPVTPDNLPKQSAPAASPAGAAPPAAPAAQPPPAPPASQPASGTASEVATDVRTQQASLQAEVQAAGGPARIAIEDLMHGRVDPDRDLAQSGARVPRYLLDAIRFTVMRSKGQLDQQTIVREALKHYLPPDVVEIAWRQHGGR